MKKRTGKRKRMRKAKRKHMKVLFVVCARKEGHVYSRIVPVVLQRWERSKRRVPGLRFCAVLVDRG